MVTMSAAFSGADAFHAGGAIFKSGKTIRGPKAQSARRTRLRYLRYLANDAAYDRTEWVGEGAPRLLYTTCTS